MILLSHPAEDLSNMMRRTLLYLITVESMHDYPKQLIARDSTFYEGGGCKQAVPQ